MVSVVIPVWGEYKKYLEECIDSVNKQTYKDYEIIVVDNKTDLPSARNEGIKKAKGEYILPLDVDDTIHPQYLEKTVNQGDIVTTACNMNGNRWLPASVISLERLRETNLIIACSLFKREIWEKIGGYDEQLVDGFEDWDFWLRAVIAGYEVKIIDEMLYNYNKRPDGMVSTMENESNTRYIIQNKNNK